MNRCYRVNCNRCLSSTDLYFVPGRIRQIQSSTPQQLLGNHELTSSAFAQCLQPACDVDRVTYRGQRSSLAISNLTDDGLPNMDSNAHPKRRIEIAGQRIIELSESNEHKSRSGQRMPGGLHIRDIDSEERYHTVADELVHVPPGGLNGLTHLLKVAI